MKDGRAPVAEVNLAIAGMGAAIHCPDEALAQALRQRYAAFPLEGRVMAGIAVRVGMVETCGDENPPPAFCVDRVRVSGARSDGSYWIEQGRGDLVVDAQQPLEQVDYFLRMVYALLAFEQGGMLMHTAAIVRQGRAYLFFGRSGAGKTTASRVSRGCVVLNDDLVMLLPDGAGWMAHGTPFWNPKQVHPTRGSAPVAGLLRLIQDKRAYLEALGCGEALAELLAGIPMIPADPARSAEMMRRGARLLASTRVHRLHFLPDDSFWNVIDF